MDPIFLMELKLLLKYRRYARRFKSIFKTMIIYPRNLKLSEKSRNIFKLNTGKMLVQKTVKAKGDYQGCIFSRRIIFKLMSSCQAVSGVKYNETHKTVEQEDDCKTRV